MQTEVSLDNVFSLTLGTAGLNQQSALFDPSIAAFYKQGRFASPFYEACFVNPWRTPFMIGVAQDEAVQSTGRPYKLVSIASRLTNAGSRRDLLGNPVKSSTDQASGPNALTAVLASMRQKGIVTDAPLSLAAVPQEVQSAAALVLHAAMLNEPYVQAAFSSTETKQMLSRLLTQGADQGNDPLAYRRWNDEMSKLDLAYLFAAGQDMTAAVQEATQLLANVSSSAQYAWSLSTKWGDIVLTGGTPTETNGRKILLMIDTGGDDTYINCPTQVDASHWLSILIDTDGNDKYLSQPSLAKTSVRETAARNGDRNNRGPGLAHFGITILMDTKGDDLYRSLSPAFGAGIFGVGVLVDRAGSDTYDAYADSIGFGKFGLGILEDVEGADRYSGFTQTQGVGLPGGVGWLLDRGGDDVYVAENELIDFPSPQTAEHNVSMSQGAGNGVRLDYINGRSQAGGVGLLFDLGGNDKYSCGVFGQGVGYWSGVGALWDRGGNDEYTGTWYAQGSAAHFGIGYLRDSGGDDVYRGLINMTQGAGHDFSLGMLIDDMGNDEYSSNSLALGGGNANGFGVFLDLAGNDKYSVTGSAVLGQANLPPEGSLRQVALTLGLFYDGAGNDTYPPKYEWAKNGARGTTAPVSKVTAGIFFDR